MIKWSMTLNIPWPRIPIVRLNRLVKGICPSTVSGSAVIVV